MTNSLPLISIIVPIYKVEPYLRRCLDSIVNQTYTNLEIILVDDGSPDNCPQICNEYAATDKRIIVIHKENGGLSDARNAGLDICKGEYISFVDSDDWVDEKYIEVLFHILNENNADISIINFEKITDLSSKIQHNENNKKKFEILNSTNAVKKLFSTHNVVFVIACGKLYKRYLFSNIRFPKGKINEDEYIAYKMLYISKKTIFFDIPLYMYLQRAESIMANIEDNSLRVLPARIERYLFFKQQKEKNLMALCLQSLCWDILFAYSQLYDKKKVCIFKSSKEAIVKYREYVHDYIFLDNFTLEKVIHIFFATFPFIYLLYRKISPYKIRKS